MKKRFKWMLAAMAFIAASAMTAAVYYGSRLAAIGTAYVAKTLCSGLFVSHRERRSLWETDLTADDLSVLRHVDVHIDQRLTTVTADLMGFAKRKAVYREGAGCTLIHGDYRGGAELAASKNPFPRNPSAIGAGNGPEPRFDRARMHAAMRWAFSEPDASRLRRTRAVVVVFKGHLIAEQYADGFTHETALIGWSMAKSIVNALVGVLVRDGRISLGDRVPVKTWQCPRDSRCEITWDHLLRMTSGMQFDEGYSNPLADVTYMLLGVPDSAAYAIAKPLEAKPGTRWSYSSGSTNIIMHSIRQIIGEQDYAEFPRAALFGPLGMTSAVMETDSAGTFVGSSFIYASARDWARFGLLYLRDGLWADQRVLPEGWVQYTRTPVLSAADGQYGAHFWLQIPHSYRCTEDEPKPPADAFHAIGHDGQFVSIVPSRDLVVVRLGFTRYPCAWDQQVFLNLILKAVSASG